MPIVILIKNTEARIVENRGRDLIITNIKTKDDDINPALEAVKTMAKYMRDINIVKKNLLYRKKFVFI